MKKLLIGLMLMSSYFVTDVNANDEEETIEVLKSSYNEYIKAFCTVYIAAIDAAIEDLENCKKYNKDSKKWIDKSIKFLKTLKSAFEDLLNRKSISTIQKSIRKITDDFELRGPNDANYDLYYRAIVLTFMLLSKPTMKSVKEKYRSYIEDVNKLFEIPGRIVRDYTYDEPSVSTSSSGTSNVSSGNSSNANATASSDEESSSSSSNANATQAVSKIPPKDSDTSSDEESSSNSSSANSGNSTNSSSGTSNTSNSSSSSNKSGGSSSTTNVSTGSTNNSTSSTSSTTTVVKPLNNKQKLMGKK